MAEPSVLQKKTEIFLERDIYPLLKNFPASEKFSLCQEIKQSCYKLIRAAVMANNLTNVNRRLMWLDEADAEKTLLLVLLGVAKNQNTSRRRNSWNCKESSRRSGASLEDCKSSSSTTENRPSEKVQHLLRVISVWRRTVRFAGTIRPATGTTTMLRTPTRTSVSAPPCRLLRHLRPRLQVRVLVILQGRGNPSPC